MTAFYMNEGRFDLQATGVVDRTVTHLVGRSPGGAEIMLIVERRPLPATKSLRQAVDEHGRDLSLRYLGYAVLFEREVEVASHPAIDVGARWIPEGREPAYTRRVHLLTVGAAPPNPSSGSTRLIVTGETPFTERAFCDASVDHVLASLRFRA